MIVTVPMCLEDFPPLQGHGNLPKIGYGSIYLITCYLVHLSSFEVGGTILTIETHLHARVYEFQKKCGNILTTENGKDS